MSEYKIVHADCLDYMAGLPAGHVDFVFYDPPYNAGKDYGAEVDDNLPVDEYYFLMEQAVNEARRISNDNIAVFISGKLTRLFWSMMPDAKLIIVRKWAAGIRDNNFFLQYHSLLCTGTPLTPVSDVWDNIRLPGEGYFYKETRTGHPGETSERLTRRAIETFCPPGGKVFDPYTGAGTTALAALRGGRSFEGCEKVQAWAEYARDRLKEARRQAQMF